MMRASVLTNPSPCMEAACSSAAASFVPLRPLYLKVLFSPRTVLIVWIGVPKIWDLIGFVYRNWASCEPGFRRGGVPLVGRFLDLGEQSVSFSMPLIFVLAVDFRFSGFYCKIWFCGESVWCLGEMKAWILRRNWDFNSNLWWYICGWYLYWCRVFFLFNLLHTFIWSFFSG